MSFADWSVDEEAGVMTVRVSAGPGRYDVRVGLLEWFLPSLGMMLVFMCLISAYQMSLPQNAGGFWGAFRQNSVFLLLPAAVLVGVLSLLPGARYRPVYVLDRAADRLARDGALLGRLSGVKAARVQQRWGWSGNLRLRLVLTANTGRRWVVAESPLLETQAGVQRFALRKAALPSPLSNDWLAFGGDKTFVDPRDA